MKIIKTYLKSKQDQFARHPFFQRLEQVSELANFNGFVKHLAFWPMAFQDILRLNEERMSDEYLHKVARHHRLEDSGHDRWYINDIIYLDPENRTSDYYFELLFDSHYTQTRDASYSILSEVFTLTDDRLRIILLLTLESSGHVFFEKTAAKVNSTNQDADNHLQYFSTSHLDVEKAHEVFEEAMEQELFVMKLPDDLRKEAVVMIDRVYDAFDLMFNGLVLTMDEYIQGKDNKTSKNAPVGMDSDQIGRVANKVKTTIAEK